jgi:acetyltransferase-like isoleucine patch superfamily enzyme
MSEPDNQRDPPESVGRFALLGNFLPLLMLVAIVAVSLVLAETLPARLAAFAGLLYLGPPLFGRLLMILFGKPEGRDITQANPAFRVWWLLLQLQMPFNRLPWLEELLRLVPGLYPLWLNLWGAHIHPATYWAPGARALDRPYVKTGYGSVIGSDTLVSGHLARMENGRFLVDIAPVVIGTHAVVGARASIGPGCVIGSGETLTATSRLAPYVHYVNGKRQ